MDESDAFNVELLDQDGLSAIAVTLGDPMNQIQRLQQSELMQPFWEYLVDMDHETIFFDSAAGDLDETRSAVAASLA